MLRAEIGKTKEMRIVWDWRNMRQANRFNLNVIFIFDTCCRLRSHSQPSPSIRHIRPTGERTVEWMMRHSDEYTYLCKSFSASSPVSHFLVGSLVRSLRYVRSLWLICSAWAQTLSLARSRVCISDMVVRLSTCIYVQTIYSLTECLNYKFFGRSFRRLFFPSLPPSSSFGNTLWISVAVVLRFRFHRLWNRDFALRLREWESERERGYAPLKAFTMILVSVSGYKVLLQRKAALLLYVPGIHPESFARSAPCIFGFYGRRCFAECG